MIVGLLFDQYRKKYSGVRQNYLGGLASYIYKFDTYYFRTDGAVSNIKENVNHQTTFNDTQTDDILFTFGKNFIVNNQSTLTLSGLFGVPTHKILRLRNPDFGYSQVGTGIQLDGSYELNLHHAFLYGARYIYFIPRNASDDLHQQYRFTIGNVGDILLAYKNVWNQHGSEIGYTMRSRFEAHISPHLDDIVKKTNYLRSSFYLVYKYKFFLNEVSNRLLVNVAYGFDHKSKIFGNKRIVTVWVSLNTAF